MEQSLVLTALLGLEVTPELLEGCQGPSLPEGAQVYRFDPQALMVMGQSQGAIYANMVGALDPRVKAKIVWPQTQQALALDGLDGILDYPVAENRIGAQGVPYTSVVVQYRGDGLADPHAIFVQLDEVKHQYGCFLETLKETGRAVVVPPGALGSPCE